MVKREDKGFSNKIVTSFSFSFWITGKLVFLPAGSKTYYTVELMQRAGFEPAKH